MATNLLNRAQITYSTNGVDNTVRSNQISTTLIDEFTATVTKAAITDTARPGTAAAYVIRVDNTGQGTLYNVSVTDDLGLAAATSQPPLTYLADSARFYINGDEVTGTATATASEVTFAVTEPLASGDNLIVVYGATLKDDAADTITNTATMTANGGSTTGTAVTAEAQAVVTPESYAAVSIVKAADNASVSSGDTLAYTFTLVNTGTAAAESVTFTDAFPSEFTVTGVSYTIDGVTTTVAASDYTITSPNTLTLPAASSTLTIPVAAATTDGPGVTIITVTGTIS